MFIRVADACSFTLAAERLGISRSAAGKCVNRLEERLATRLLQRTTRSVSLTEDGAVFYEYAQRILSQAEEAETALNTRRQTPRGGCGWICRSRWGDCISCRFCGSFGAVAGGGRRRQLLR